MKIEEMRALLDEAKAFQHGTVRSWKRGTMMKSDKVWQRLPQGKPPKTIPPAPMPTQSTMGGNSYVDNMSVPVSEMLARIAERLTEGDE